MDDCLQVCWSQLGSTSCTSSSQSRPPQILCWAVLPLHPQSVPPHSGRNIWVFSFPPDFLSVIGLVSLSAPDSSPCFLSLIRIYRSLLLIPHPCYSALHPHSRTKPQEASPEQRPSAPHQFFAMNTFNWFSGSVPFLTSENHACVDLKPLLFSYCLRSDQRLIIMVYCINLREGKLFTPLKIIWGYFSVSLDRLFCDIS